MATPIPTPEIPGVPYTEHTVDVSDLKIPLVEPEETMVSL